MLETAFSGDSILACFGVLASHAIRRIPQLSSNDQLPWRETADLLVCKLVVLVVWSEVGICCSCGLKSKAPSDKDGGQDSDKEEEEPQLEHAVWEAKLKFLQVAFTTKTHHILCHGFWLLCCRQSHDCVHDMSTAAAEALLMQACN